MIKTYNYRIKINSGATTEVYNITATDEFTACDTAFDFFDDEHPQYAKNNVVRHVVSVYRT